MGINHYHYDKPFTLESGGVLPEVDIVYHTYGELSPGKDNVIWVCHALTANSDVAEWWPGTVVKGGFLDPEKYFIVCANYLSSPYGSTSPVSVNPATGEPYFGDFPMVTVRDMVRCHELLRRHLGIDRIKLLAGGSTGGFQVLEWELLHPGLSENLLLLACAAKSTPWVIAASEAQRMAIEADATFGEPRADAARNGLMAARAIAMLTYRNWTAYNSTQQEDTQEKLSGFRAAGYQRYQGRKLADRFDVYSYYRLIQALDSHHIGRGRGSLEEVLSTIKAKGIVIGIDSDILFSPGEHRFMADHIPDSDLYLIQSDFGHDGFLIEHEQLNTIINRYL